MGVLVGPALGISLSTGDVNGDGFDDLVAESSSRVIGTVRPTMPVYLPSNTKTDPPGG